jgi:hypothetical protein
MPWFSSTGDPPAIVVLPSVSMGRIVGKAEGSSKVTAPTDVRIRSADGRCRATLLGVAAQISNLTCLISK